MWTALQAFQGMWRTLAKNYPQLFGAFGLNEFNLYTMNRNLLRVQNENARSKIYSLSYNGEMD